MHRPLSDALCNILDCSITSKTKMLLMPSETLKILFMPRINHCKSHIGCCLSVFRYVSTMHFKSFSYNFPNIFHSSFHCDLMLLKSHFDNLPP